jgi:hypothetical protein
MAKERVRVQAGREGGPRIAAAAAVPAIAARSQLPTGSAPTTLYHAVIQAARDPSVDAAKMKELVALAMQIEAHEAERAFTRAFNALQFDLPTINKDGFIDHGDGRTQRGHAKLKTKFSTYPNLMHVCRPLLKEHGFTFNNVIEPAADGARIEIVGYLVHIDGAKMVSRFPLGADAGPGRSNAQAWGSSTSYGKRYNLILMLDIVSKDPRDADDDSRKTPKPENAVDLDVPLNEQQLIQLSAEIEKCGVGLDKVLDKYGIGELGELPAIQFNDAMKACKNYAEETARRSTAQTPAKAGRSADDDNDMFPGDRH